MRKKGKRILFAALMLALLLSLCAFPALAGGPGGEEPPGGFGGGDMGGEMGDMGGGAAPAGDAAPEQAAIYLQDGALVAENEYEAGKYDAYVTADGASATISGLELTSGDYSFNGIVAKGAGSSVTLDKCTILLTVDAPVTSDAEGGAAVAVDDGATMYINDSTLTVDGAARYVTSAYNDATLVVNNSTVTSTGMNENTQEIAEPFSNEALLISGNARANFSIGATKTYYFNSRCIAEGWAALSTDSATGDGLDLYAYNTEAVAQNGGYATYADTNCRVWLYGSTLSSGEIGAIISKSGQILLAGTDETPDEVAAYNLGESVEKTTTLTGGRNAVMIHAPDMMGEGKSAADCGTLTVRNSKLATSKELSSTKDYHDYSDAVAAYVDYVSGADILVRSTSANITLDNAELESYSGVLVLTALNSDSMGNFLDEGDGWEVGPVAVTMQNMQAEGDIRHMDYQRLMTLELDNATLSGAVVSGTMADWNALWTDFAGEDLNWVVDDSFGTTYGVQMTLKNGAVWNVTGLSSLSSLTVEAGAQVNGVLIANGVQTEIEAGKTYTGKLYLVAEAPEALTGAEALSDYAGISNQAAVAALLEAGAAIAIPDGNGGWAFEPQETLSRAEMAQLIADLTVEEIPAAASAPFSDTADSWAAGAIAYLAQSGVVDGDGAGSFRPDEAVTVGEAAKLVLAAQGVSGLTGAGWKDAVASAGQAAGLLSADADLDALLTRDAAAKMLVELISETSEEPKPEAEPEAETETDSLRASYPYVSAYSAAYENVDATMADYTEGTVLVRFTVTERLEDTAVETDMMEGLGLSEEELQKFEEDGARYLTTTYERYAVTITASATDAAEAGEAEILHNTLFGEMASLLEPGTEFAAFLTQSEQGLICNFETLYYYTDTGTLLSVVEDAVSAQLDGVTWEQAAQTYAS